MADNTSTDQRKEGFSTRARGSYILLPSTSSSSPEPNSSHKFTSPTRRACLLSAGIALAIALASLANLTLQSRLQGQSLDIINGINPYALPGWLDFDPADPFATTWRPYGANSTPTVDWLAHIRIAEDRPLPLINTTYGDSVDDHARWNTTQRYSTLLPNVREDEQTRTRLRASSLDQLQHLQNKTILLLGDSLDRNTVWYLSQNIASEASVHLPQYANASDFDFTNHSDWSLAGTPHLLKLHGDVKAEITNCFLYGHDDSDFFAYQPEWHGPGKSEDRIEHLCKPYVDQLAYPVAMIQYQSGMWDLALFGRQDALAENGRVEDPLSAERLQWWRNRTLSTILKIKETWPGVPIVYRTMHRPATDRNSRDFLFDTGKALSLNLFADVRAAQIRQLQLQITAEENLWLFEFGKIYEGY